MFMSKTLKFKLVCVDIKLLTGNVKRSTSATKKDF